MNSLLQQLFMITQFSKGILELNIPFNEDKLISQLQVLLGTLERKLCSVYNPIGIANTIRDFDGKKLLVTEQRDIDEFFNLFSIRLEDELKESNNNNFIKEIFGGIAVTEISGNECNHKKEKAEEFLTLNLQIKGKNDIHESLKSFIESESLEGDDAYYCERCDNKVNAKKRVTIKMMPNYLLFILKRFKYDYKTAQKEKINDHYAFPLDLDMKEYSREFNKEENIYPKEYYLYSLKGVVLHMGTAESGHYTSLIRTDNNWYEFNDTRVIEFDFNRLPEEAFGGTHEFIDDLYMTDRNDVMFNKIKNAYLLIYERKNYYNLTQLATILKLPHYDTQEMLLNFNEAIISFTPPKLSHELTKYLVEELIKNNVVHTVFTIEFLTFNYKLMENHSSIIDDDWVDEGKVEKEEVEKVSEVWKYFTVFIFLVMLRSKRSDNINEDKEYLYNVLKMYKKGLKSNVDICGWLIEDFSSIEVITEFLIKCSSSSSRFFTYSSLVTAFKVVYNLEKKKLGLLTELEALHDCFKKEGMEIKDEEGTKRYLLSPEHQVPLTVIFANNLLYVLLKSELQEKPFKDISLLLVMICKIAPEIKRILLVEGIVNVMFEVAFNKAGINRSISKDIPLLVVQKKILIERRITVEKIEDNPTKNFKNFKNFRFFLYLLAELLSDCTIVNGDGRYELEERELNLLNFFFDESVYQGFPKLAVGRLAGESMAKIMIAICKNNKELSGKLIFVFFERITTSAPDDLYKYTASIESIVIIEDEFTSHRLEKYLKYFGKIIEDHISCSYITYTYMVDSFIRTASKFKLLRKELQDNPNKYKPIKKWLKDNYYPNTEKDIFWLSTKFIKIPIRFTILSDGNSSI